MQPESQHSLDDTQVSNVAANLESTVHTVDESPNNINPTHGWLQNTNNWPYSSSADASPRQQDFPTYFDYGTENPRGELGYYLISEGGANSYRSRIRAPSFCNLSILSHLLPGHMIADVATILGSFDFVMGECDR